MPVEVSLLAILYESADARRQATMGLREQLEADMRAALRARDQRRISAIRMLRAAIANYEIARTDRKNPQYGRPVTEDDLVGVLRKELSQRREALQFAEQAGRT